MISTLIADFRIIFERDPAARNWLEVLFCYPGLQALIFHRFAHWLHKFKIPFIPRLISAFSRFVTGIEIHPGAVIGKSVFIDHGMGVVIGETAIVGDYALIYQGVTLGGTGKESGKRHPTLGENVVVGAGAKVLGNLEIGDNVRIGAGSVVLRDVPSDCTVVGIPGRILYKSGVRVNPLEHGSLPDSEAAAIRALVDRLESLEAQVQDLQQNQSPVNWELPIFDLRSPTNCQHSISSKSEEYSQALDSLVSNSSCTLLSSPSDSSYTTKAIARKCLIKDKVIEEFLDGAGI